MIMLADDLSDQVGLIEPIAVPATRSDMFGDDAGAPPAPESWGGPDRLRAEMILAMAEYAKWLAPKLKDGLASVGVYEAMAMLLSQMKTLQNICADERNSTKDRVMAANAAAGVAKSVAELAAQLSGVQARGMGPSVAITNKPPPAGAILISNQVLMRDNGKAAAEKA